MKKSLAEQLDIAARKWAKTEAAGDERVAASYVEGARFWQRAASKQLGSYEREMTRAHEEMIGPVSFAIKIQIRKAARLWEKVDRLHDELDMVQSFIRFNMGSTKQMKEEIDPRLAVLEKYERTLDAVLTSLGLTYNATPSKVKEEKKRGVDATKDGLSQTISNAKESLTDIPDDFE